MSVEIISGDVANTPTINADDIPNEVIKFFTNSIFDWPATVANRPVAAEVSCRASDVRAGCTHIVGSG